MNFIFLMDSLEAVIFEKDTSLMLMIAAERQGHHVYHLPDGGMTLVDGHLHFYVTRVTPQPNKDNPFVLQGERNLTADEIDAVFIRTDPPFDYNYLMHTWLLDKLPPHIPVINRPSGIRTANEKIWVTQFGSIVPKNLVGRNRAELLGFLNKEKDIVAKPTDGFGGQSVFRIQKGEPNANVILETLTQNFTRDIILQKFIPESDKGDKRILLLNGEPLGAVLRVHSKDDYRNNFFSGGKPVATDINARDKEIIQILQPELKKLGLYFVGIDILGGYLIEVNVTSPTCMQEINRLSDQHLEDRVIAFVENWVELGDTYLIQPELGTCPPIRG